MNRNSLPSVMSQVSSSQWQLVHHILTTVNARRGSSRFSKQISSFFCYSTRKSTIEHATPGITRSPDVYYRITAHGRVAQGDMVGPGDLDHFMLFAFQTLDQHNQLPPQSLL